MNRIEGIRLFRANLYRYVVIRTLDGQVIRGFVQSMDQEKICLRIGVPGVAYQNGCKEVAIPYASVMAAGPINPI